MTSEILTSLSFLDENQEWPPKTQRARLAKYQKNRRLFDKKKTINRSAYNHIVQVMGDTWRIVPYKILINFYRKISFKTADLLFIEPPLYVGSSTEEGAEDKSKELNAIVQDIAENSDLNGKGHTGAIDASRYGDSVYVVRKKDIDGKEKGVLTISQPQYWFPVSDPEDLKETKYHVITRKTFNKKEGGVKYYDLHIYIYSKTQVEKRKAVLKGDKIESVEVVEAPTDTGFSDFVIIPIQGVLTSDTSFGIDDYTDVEDIVTELQVRIQQNSRILDKHADPSMSGPAEALSTDPDTGEATVAVGNYFKRNSKESATLEYIVWDGQLEASFKEIKLLMDLLAIISEMGAAIIDADIRKAGNISGRALKMMYINALNKVARLRNSFDKGYKQAILLCSQVGYESALEKKNISIEWRDGLPDDPFESATIGKLRLGDAASDSVVSQIMKQDGLLRPAAEKKLEQMIKESGREEMSDRIDLANGALTVKAFLERNKGMTPEEAQAIIEESKKEKNNEGFV